MLSEMQGWLTDHFQFLANVSSLSRSLYAIARPSVVCLYRSCALLNRLKFRQCFYAIAHWYLDIHGKFYGDRPRGTPPLRGLNARGVAKYSDFEAFGGHILETVQDMR